jgi:hypothetical protein
VDRQQAKESLFALVPCVLLVALGMFYLAPSFYAELSLYSSYGALASYAWSEGAAFLRWGMVPFLYVVFPVVEVAAGYMGVRFALAFTSWRPNHTAGVLVFTACVFALLGYAAACLIAFTGDAEVSQLLFALTFGSNDWPPLLLTVVGVGLGAGRTVI